MKPGNAGGAKDCKHRVDDIVREFQKLRERVEKK